MKTTIAITMTLALALLFGCQSMGSRGGREAKNQGFKISASEYKIEVRQGELQTMVITLERDSLFKQDVKLRVIAASGISVEPASISVKANERPDIQFQITAPEKAALGEYPVVVHGIPEAGLMATMGFTVKVIVP